MERTTILLRPDVKGELEREFGKRKMSEAVNEILFQELVAKKIKKKKDLFGADKWLKKKGVLAGLRDERDRF